MKKTIENVSHLFLIFALSSCQYPQNKLEAKFNKVIKTSLERVDHQSAEAIGSTAAIATQGIYSTDAAKAIFKLGGNAIDAAIAASFVLSVERPHSTGIGGGGFMLFREGKTKKIYAIDFRERAPLLATEKMFLDNDGNVIPKLSIDGVLAAAVPGMVAGLLEIHQKFGRLKREQVITPAIELAEKGFPIYPSLEKALVQKAEILAKDPEAKKIFLTKDGHALPLGHRLIQKDLAKTLRIIAKKGKAGFYKGAIAKEYVELNKKSKGLLSYSDLNSYEVKWRSPIVGTYKDHTIVSMPPPSSGGVHIIEFLNLLENDSLYESGLLEAKSIHLAASAFQLAFADRARYLGDSDFVKVPTLQLISKEYAHKRRAEIDSDKRKNSSDVTAYPFPGFEHTETTHLSIMDNEGNVISTTQTINGYMGASVVVPHTGIVLNNEMDDFSAKAGASNLFGAIGGNANAIAAKKTPLSSMSPTIILKNNEPVMSVGAPGGTRIITCVAQTLLNYLEFKLPLYESISTIRYHHQWLPDVLDIDPPGPTPKVFNQLRKWGYNININAVPCNVMAVTHENDLFHAVSDPRDIGTSTAL